MGDLNIVRGKGNLPITVPTEDAVICMLFTGAAVAGKIALGVPTQVYTIKALETYGITNANNPVAFKDITDFYEKAGEGAELNFMLVADTTSLEDMCNINNDIAKKLLDSTQGRAVVLLVNKKIATGYTITASNGFDGDVWAAVTKLNALAVDYDNNNIPFVGILPGFGFTAATIANIPARNTLSNDFVGLNLWCKANDGIVSQGMLAGMIAKRQVHQNVGAVEFGKVADTAFFPDGTAYITLKASIIALRDKGLIVPLKRGQKSGYYYGDDPTLTATTRVYSSISWNRTINKAKRIAADRLLEKLNGEVEVDPNTGNIETALAADWESEAETAIKQAMMKETPTKRKEISGAKITIDLDSDIANNEVDYEINIVRKGQAKTINATIQYTETV